MPEKRKNKRPDHFGDWMAHLYPELVNPDDQFNTITKTFTFQVTDKCNLACSYCYQINKGVRRMSVETAKLAVDKILSGADGFGDYLKNAQGIILEFIGGEPFLEIDLIDEIVDYFKMRAIELNHPWAEKHMISICSNGVLYRDKKVQRFLQKNSNHISFSVTVDGTKELHDSCRKFPDGRPSYDLAHDAAMDWGSRGYYMGSKITLAPANIMYTSECLIQMIRDGYTDINANTVFEKGWQEEHAVELYKQLKTFSNWMDEMGCDKYDYYISIFDDDGTGFPQKESENNNWCGTTGAMLAMDPDGKIFTCIRFMESSLGEERPAYDIGDVWNGIGKKPEHVLKIKCLNCITRRSQTEDSCFYCPIAHGCAHCTAYNYQETGTPNKKVTYSCEMHKARCLAINYYWNTYYKIHNIDNVVDLYVPKTWALPIIGEEEYNRLVELTKSLGGYVNEDAIEIKAHEGFGKGLSAEKKKEQITVLKREE